MTLNETMLCHYAECRILFIILLNVIMLILVMPNAVMLSVVMLNDVASFQSRLIFVGKARSLPYRGAPESYFIG